MDAHVFDYIKRLTIPSVYPFNVMEREAKAQHIPIMEPDGIAFLKQLIRLHRPTRILEIGAAIGYSALQMASVHANIRVVTVERDDERFKTAVENIHQYDQHQQVEILHGDAFDLADQLNSKGPYDLVFIDAAKGQYQRFFETFTTNLTDQAMIITDNVLFKGYVSDASVASKRLAKLSQKIDRYNQWLTQLEGFTTVIVPVGDGVAITTRHINE
ncbi:putative O-methyltransferase YrrM [Halolactibacillus miurensis]|uniref:tRNA 5-hydroxyuridine methyltransferase n=1 Tax=Halolactibacillus miurensis TaxID=306541 RepID=A0A1I6PMF5_9BACI|nr:MULTISPECIES: O-methyltransferase [Halolactibacillus]GEM03746.1 putative O-methyltransferase YrrM [Halolactibacillus miurensis]SFS41397.1 Predicted O-methyltransferase YrrM [Halolactibacillus miurensis]